MRPTDPCFELCNQNQRILTDDCQICLLLSQGLPVEETVDPPKEEETNQNIASIVIPFTLLLIVVLFALRTSSF